jgi:hypothetical protein
MWGFGPRTRMESRRAILCVGSASPDVRGVLGEAIGMVERIPVALQVTVVHTCTSVYLFSLVDVEMSIMVRSS